MLSVAKYFSQKKLNLDKIYKYTVIKVYPRYVTTKDAEIQKKNTLPNHANNFSNQDYNKAEGKKGYYIAK